MRASLTTSSITHLTLLLWASHPPALRANESTYVLITQNHSLWPSLRWKSFAEIKTASRLVLPERILDPKWNVIWVRLPPKQASFLRIWTRIRCWNKSKPILAMLNSSSRNSSSLKHWLKLRSRAPLFFKIWTLLRKSSDCLITANTWGTTSQLRLRVLSTGTNRSERSNGGRLKVLQDEAINLISQA